MTSLPDDLVLRRATEADLPLLTALNMQLIEDQAHDNPAGSTELEHRLRHWLSGA